MNEFDTKRKGVGVMIVETGEEFNSIQSCADYLGVSASWLGRVVRGDSGLRTCHGYHVIQSDNNVNLFDYLKSEYRGRPGRRVRVVETGEEFSSITKCADFIGGSPGAIHDAASGNRSRHTHKGLHFEMVN